MGGRTNRGGWGADRRTVAGGQTRGRRADGRTSGRANGRMRADEARIGPTSGWADGRMSTGLKGPAPRSPLHSLAPRLLASL